MLRSVRQSAVCFAALGFFPVAARASFGAGPCGEDFGCHFTTWGLLLGTVGLPVAGAAFALLHAIFCHPMRSKMKQLLVGGFLGLVAYEIAAVAGALMGVSGRDVPLGMLPALLLLGLCSVIYARSAPADRETGMPGRHRSN